MRLAVHKMGAGALTGFAAFTFKAATPAAWRERLWEWLDDRAIVGAARLARLGRWDQMRRAFVSGRGFGLSAFEIEQCVWRCCEARELRAAKAAASALSRRAATGKAPLAVRLIEAGRWRAVAGLARLCAQEPRFRDRLLGPQNADRESLMLTVAREAARLGPQSPAGAWIEARAALESFSLCGEAVDGFDLSGARALGLAAGDRDPAGLLGQGAWAEQLCETLTRLGARVEAVGGREPRSPLTSAARALSCGAIKALLTAGADPKAQDAQGASAAHALCASARWASDQGDSALEGLRLLMEAGASVRSLDARGMSPRDALVDGVFEPKSRSRLERLQAKVDELEAQVAAREIAQAMGSSQTTHRKEKCWL